MLVTGNTKIVAIIGNPIEHTLSPLMHNTAFRNLGLDFLYVPFRVENSQLSKAIDGLRAMNIVGANVTIPHKERVIDFLDEISPEAERIGAVNTIVNRNAKLCGYNTDGDGFVFHLSQREGIDIKGKRVALLGAGGAARSVGFALAQKGVSELKILNRNLEKAQLLAADIRDSVPACIAKAEVLLKDNLKILLENVDILINSLPIGMFPNIDQSPIEDPNILPNDIVLCDLIYNPGMTKLMQIAATKGIKVYNGLGMLVAQGALAFELWTGQQAPWDLMYDTLQEYLQK